MGCRHHFVVASSLKSLSMRVVLDLLDQFTITIVLSLFHNRMWQSRYNGFPVLVMICFIFNVEVLAVMRGTSFGRHLARDLRHGKQRVCPVLS